MRYLVRKLNLSILIQLEGAENLSWMGIAFIWRKAKLECVLKTLFLVPDTHSTL